MALVAWISALSSAMLSRSEGASKSCENTIIGQTHCVEARLFPENSCLGGKPKLNITPTCVNGKVEFKIENQGNEKADNLEFTGHILGIELLPTLVLRWAADVNGGGSITTADLVEIRKLILGLQTKFTNKPNWAVFSLDNADSSFQFCPIYKYIFVIKKTAR